MNNLVKKVLTRTVLLFLHFTVLAQNEKIIFNLSEGKFDNPTIPYVNPIVIAGVPIKNKENVDAITLIVTKVSSKEQQEVMAKQYQVDQLSKQIESNTNMLNFLKDEIKDKAVPENVGDLEIKLSEKKQTSLAEKFSAIAGQGTTPQSAQITDLNNAVTTEITRLQSEINKENSNLIQLKAEIVELEGVVGAGKFFEGTWVRTSDGDDEFTFAMPDKLKMAEKYTFNFTIYKKNKVIVPIDKLLNPLVSDFNAMLDAEGYYETTSIRARVSAVIKVIEDSLFANVYSIDASVNKISPKKGFNLSASVVTNLTVLIEDFYAAQQDVEAEGEITAQNKILILNKINARNITASQRDGILSLIEVSGNSAPLRTALTDAGYPTAEVDEMIEFYEVIRRATDAIASNQTKVTNARREIQKIFDDIKTLYTSVGTVTSTSSTGATDIDGVIVSTTYGIGVVSLDKNTIEWFRFFGVNIRLDGFDNRLPGKEAYHSGWSRLSLMIGISTTSDMQYKGNALENTRLGIKPVIGFNWEPVKHLNIGAGAISFIQESTSESQKDPKIRPYVSLSFDFNLFNYLIQKQ